MKCSVRNSSAVSKRNILLTWRGFAATELPRAPGGRLRQPACGGRRRFIRNRYRRKDLPVFRRPPFRLSLIVSKLLTRIPENIFSGSRLNELIHRNTSCLDCGDTETETMRVPLSRGARIFLTILPLIKYNSTFRKSIYRKERRLKNKNIPSELKALCFLHKAKYS